MKLLLPSFLARLQRAIVVTSVVHVPVPVTLRQSFLEVHILTTSHHRAFILGPKVPCSVGLHSVTLDQGSMFGCGARGQNLVHLQNVVFLHQSFLEVHILTTTNQKAFILGP